MITLYVVGFAALGLAWWLEWFTKQEEDDYGDEEIEDQEDGRDESS